MPNVSIVVPTYNEGGNVEELVRRLSASFTDDDAEILFVDDSTDDTPAIIQETARRSAFPVRMLHREGASRQGGLAGAVTDGIRSSESTYVVIMDGDLQHPPELAPVLRDVARGHDADLVVASRYCGNGDSSGLSSSFRRSVSSSSTMLARSLFPRRVGAKCTDPMTGFFCFRREAVNLDRLRPRGFKILLEVLASHDLRVQEVPFVFGERHAGESKASWANGLQFLRQLMSLRMTRPMWFAAVGGIGLLLNLLIMAVLLRLGVHYVLASVLATEAAIVNNFLLQERFVFADLTGGHHGWLHRAWRSVLYNNLDNAVRLPLLVLLVERVGVMSLLAQTLTLIVSFGARFLYTSKVVYRPAFPESVAVPERVPATAFAQPPTDAEKDLYLAGPQHRWVFWFSSLAFAGVAYSLAGLAAQSAWTAVFFIPLIVLAIEQGLSLRTSTFKSRIGGAEHRAKIDSWQPVRRPSIDVFLPVRGEDLALLANTAEHVSRLQWSGPLTVYLLDDGNNCAVRDLAREHGFTYLARDTHEFKKAGNLQHGYRRSSGDHIVIFDADFVPRPDFLMELVPYLDEESVGIVQSPQYFDTHRTMGWLERTAGATQELFFRLIQPSRDAVGAAICVGTSAIYRRSALEAIGGFPQIGHSEDVFTGVRMATAGYRLQYVPVLVSRGKCPEDIDAFIAQQYRWCEGSMTLAGDVDFHDEPSLTLMQRVSFWSGFFYYLSTAMNAVIAPLPILVMVFFFPGNISALNMLPLIGVIILWLVVLPLVSAGRWRAEVLRAQTIYGFAHLFCIVDMFRGRVMEWVPTGASTGRGVAVRVNAFLGPYLLITQILVFAGLIRGALEYGLITFGANLVVALFGAYIFLPVAWASLGSTYRARLGSTGTPQPEPAVNVIDLTALERPVRTPAPLEPRLVLEGERQ